ncbi:hypothetical protein WA026_003135 [Henosepilachna vigintioctopunctata]|uniref:ZAD domain-containing protein n=1 Tax=Henosepilachna vigintioctopunctata TaxID=420089 RepID=A0AAW1TJ06_9CUCU
MYYLAKFCRICIKSDVDLVDVESDDVDSIRLSQKLKECTKMVISSENFSSKICSQCVKKLRISYEFHNMCLKSTTLLQGLLSELINDSDKISPESFTNSEIRVTLSPLKLSHNATRKRITKTERCSILKSLLSSKTIFKKNSFCDFKDDNHRGGLRNILAFTRNFNFGNVESNSSTALSDLVKFSENFFKRDFTAFQETVLFIIENNSYLNEDEMFDSCPEELDREIPFEEVVIEPDIRIKTELLDEEEINRHIECDKRENDRINNIFVKHENLDEYCDQRFESSLSHTENDLLSTNLSYSTQFNAQKMFPRNSVRCRTRGNPYINPQLKKQFMLRSFQCKKCPRYFKTPGYLKAHTAKVHNALH